VTAARRPRGVVGHSCRGDGHGPGRILVRLMRLLSQGVNRVSGTAYRGRHGTCRIRRPLQESEDRRVADQQHASAVACADTS
jgi:hypothetical protein